MRYYLTRASLDFPYPGARLKAPTIEDVPAELYAADPPPPVEADGNTRHLYFWSPVDYRWDEQANIDDLRDSIELQGHRVSGIHLTVLRTSGQPSPPQQLLDELAQQRQAIITAGGVDTELD